MSSSEDEKIVSIPSTVVRRAGGVRQRSSKFKMSSEKASISTAVQVEEPAKKKNKVIQCVSSSRSSSSSDDNDDSADVNPYKQIPPSGGMFDAKIIVDFFEDLKSNMPDVNPIRLASVLNETKRKFKKSPTDKQHFCQFSYKKAPTLFLVTNAYGIFITNSDDYMSRTVVHDIKALLPKHRVSLLVPTADHWWNDDSRLLMRGFIEQFINDLKLLATNANFRAAIDRFNIKDIPAALDALRTKILTGTKLIEGKTVPSLFGFRIINTPTQPSTINVSLAKVESKTAAVTAKWKELINPSHLHTMLLVSIKGFKITKCGFSLDMVLDSMLYDKIKLPALTTPACGSKAWISKFIKDKKKQDSDSSSDDTASKFDTSNW